MEKNRPTPEPKPEEILENNGFDFDQFEIDNEYSAKNLLKAMQEYADRYHKSKLKGELIAYEMYCDPDLDNATGWVEKYLKTKG